MRGKTAPIRRLKPGAEMSFFLTGGLTPAQQISSVKYQPQDTTETEISSLLPALERSRRCSRRAGSSSF